MAPIMYPTRGIGASTQAMQDRICDNNYLRHHIRYDKGYIKDYDNKIEESYQLIKNIVKYNVPVMNNRCCLFAKACRSLMQSYITILINSVRNITLTRYHNKWLP